MCESFCKFQNALSTWSEKKKILYYTWNERMARIIREPPAPEKARVRDDINANFFVTTKMFSLSEITMFLPRGRRRRWTITETRKPSNYKNFILTNEKIMLCRHTPRRERVRLLRRHVQHKKMNKLSFNLTSNIYKYSKKYAETLFSSSHRFLSLSLVSFHWKYEGGKVYYIRKLEFSAPSRVFCVAFIMID